MNKNTTDAWSVKQLHVDLVVVGVHADEREVRARHRTVNAPSVAWVRVFHGHMRHEIPSLTVLQHFHRRDVTSGSGWLEAYVGWVFVEVTDGDKDVCCGGKRPLTAVTCLHLHADWLSMLLEVYRLQLRHDAGPWVHAQQVPVQLLGARRQRVGDFSIDTGVWVACSEHQLSK